MSNEIVIPTSYLGNLSYYRAIKNCSSYKIELFENYQKQSLRNRTSILGANGVIDLTIPIVKKHGSKILVKDSEIDYTMGWQKVHYRAILSSYKSSPYFEHYIDHFMAAFESKPKFLVDYNSALHQKISKILKLTASEQFTNQYIAQYDNDLRAQLSKKQGVEDKFAPYYQVFSEKIEFVPNLSILDLIFCEGPSANSYL